MTVRRSKESHEARRPAAPEVVAAGGVLVLVDRAGRILASPGWEETFGPPPRTIEPGAEGPEALLEAVAGAVEESRSKDRLARRYVEVSLDRRRTYSVAAGPCADGGQEPETAVLVSEISDAFSAGPKEGEEIRQLGHDLRTPLTSMGGAVELLQTGRLGRLSPEQARLLGMIRQGLDLMLSLIDEATLPHRRAAGVAGPKRGRGGGGGATS